MLGSGAFHAREVSSAVPIIIAATRREIIAVGALYLAQSRANPPTKPTHAGKPAGLWFLVGVWLVLATALSAAPRTSAIADGLRIDGEEEVRTPRSRETQWTDGARGTRPSCPAARSIVLFAAGAEII